MYSSRLEQRLILPDIESILQDYVSIQQDIDNTRLKAAQNMAQDLDLKRIIKQEGLQRCIKVGQLIYDNQLSLDELPINDNGGTGKVSQADKDLFLLIVPALCHFTFARLNLNFHGSYTESGWTQEEFAEIRGAAKSIAKESKGIAETYMVEVIEFIKAENPSDNCADTSKLTSRIRTMGGKEFKGRHLNLNNSGQGFSRSGADPYYIPNN